MIVHPAERRACDLCHWSALPRARVGRWNAPWRPLLGTRLNMAGQIGRSELNEWSASVQPLAAAARQNLLRTCARD
jgi:hypothetical protein